MLKMHCRICARTQPNVRVFHRHLQQLSCCVGKPTFIDSCVNDKAQSRPSTRQGATMATSLTNKNRMLSHDRRRARGRCCRVRHRTGLSAARAECRHGRSGAALRRLAGERRRCRPWRHIGARADADRRLPSDGQGPELPRACQRSRLCRAGVEPGGDGRDRWPTRRSSPASPRTRRNSTRWCNPPRSCRPARRTRKGLPR